MIVLILASLVFAGFIAGKTLPLSIATWVAALLLTLAIGALVLLTSAPPAWAADNLPHSFWDLVMILIYVGPLGFGALIGRVGRRRNSPSG
jgi:hypothetical protein